MAFARSLTMSHPASFAGTISGVPHTKVRSRLGIYADRHRFAPRKFGRCVTAVESRHM